MPRDAARPKRPLLADGHESDAGVTDASRGVDVHRSLPVPPRFVAWSVVAVLALIGSAVGTRTALDVEPTALEIFRTDARAIDDQAREELLRMGVPMLGEPRVIDVEGFTAIVAVRAPKGTGESVRANFGTAPANGLVPLPPVGPDGVREPVVVPEDAEVCLWLINPENMPRGRCSDVATFTASGLAAAMDTETLETVTVWSPSGSLQVQTIPRGPATLEELRALEIPAVQGLEAEPRNVEEDNDVAGLLDGLGRGEVVIRPRMLGMTDRYLLAAGIVRPTSDGGLQACVGVMSRDIDRIATLHCLAIPVFQATGNSVEVDLGAKSLTWEWTPAGEFFINGQQL